MIPTHEPEYRIRIGRKYVAHCMLFAGHGSVQPLLTHHIDGAFRFRVDAAHSLADQINGARLGNNKAHAEPILALGDAA